MALAPTICRSSHGEVHCAMFSEFESTLDNLRLHANLFRMMARNVTKARIEVGGWMMEGENGEARKEDEKSMLEK